MNSKQIWESTGIMDGMSEYKKDILVEKLKEFREWSEIKNVVVTPAMIYGLGKMIDEDIPCGDMAWYISIFKEYYDKNPDPSFELEDHWDYGVIHCRIHGFLKWWSNKRSLIL